MSSPAPIIALLTDFGTRDSYVAAMKGVILSIAPEARLVDMGHEVPRQDVHAAARFLLEAGVHYPPHTTFCAVIDPGVGTERAPIVIGAGDATLVGPDNGILIPLAHALAGTTPLAIHRITPGRLTRDAISNTFHGRDLFAPVAAHLASGVAVSTVGPRLEGAPVTLHTPSPSRVEPGAPIEGQIAHVDHFGNLITNIPEALLETWSPERVRLTLTRSGASVVGLRGGYAERPDGEPLLVIGSSGVLELSVSMGSAADRFDASRGDAVLVDETP